MIVNPDAHLARCDSGCRRDHRALRGVPESSPHPVIDSRARLPFRAAINPSTPAQLLEDVLESCDLALVMTIDPGFGGQSLIPRTLTMVEQLRREVERQGWKRRSRSDGCVDASQCKACVDAGADVSRGHRDLQAKDGPRGGVAAPPAGPVQDRGPMTELANSSARRRQRRHRSASAALAARCRHRSKSIARLVYNTRGPWWPAATTGVRMIDPARWEVGNSQPDSPARRTSSATLERAASRVSPCCTGSESSRRPSSTT